MCQRSAEAVLDFIALDLLHNQGSLLDEDAALIGGNISTLLGKIAWDVRETVVPPTTIMCFARVLSRLIASSGIAPTDEHPSANSACL